MFCFEFASYKERKGQEEKEKGEAIRWQRAAVLKEGKGSAQGESLAMTWQPGGGQAWLEELSHMRYDHSNTDRHLAVVLSVAALCL